MTNKEILNLLEEIDIACMEEFKETYELQLCHNILGSYLLFERVLWDAGDYPETLTVEDLKKQLIEEFTIVAKEVDHILEVLKK